MDQKKEYIAKLANNLIASNSKMTGAELADNLNTNGHLTYSHNQYVVGGRGIYRIIEATYNSLKLNKRQPEADNVAIAFTNANGDPAYEK